MTWLESLDDPVAGPFGSARVSRVDGRIQVDPPVFEPLPGIPASDVHDAALRLENAATGQQPLVCPAGRRRCATAARTSSIPLAWIGCGSGPPRPGPSWLDTRPLGLVGPSSDPRLLVAAGLDWFPYIGGPSVPSPAAAGAPGAWRTGSSQRFALVEVPLTALTSGSTAPGRAAAHRPDRVPGRARRARLAGRDAPAHARRRRSRRRPHPATRRCSPTLPRSSTRTCWTANSAG